MAIDIEEILRIRRVLAQKLRLAQFFGAETLEVNFAAAAAMAGTGGTPTSDVSMFEGTVPQKDGHLPEEKQQAMLDAIAEQVAACSKCVLHESRHNVVPGEGSPAARLVFIGEGPGEQEDLQGRPFVGRAGKMLDKIIAAMGLAREDVFIGNIVKCRPPGNRAPAPTEAVDCMPYLQQQIEIIAPEVIVALGATAAKWLLETRDGISKLRGRFHDYRGIPLMPTYHPAYLLRAYTPENRRKVWDDMLKVCDKLGITPPKKK